MANSILTKKLAEIKKKYPIGIYEKKGYYRLKVLGHKIAKHGNKEFIITEAYYTNNPNFGKEHFGSAWQGTKSIMNGYSLIK